MNQKATVASAGLSEAVNILLVDDQQANLNALEAILNPADYRLVHARSAQEALLTLLDGEFAAIVLDINMPLVNGIELAQIIKQRAKTRDIPILFLTAYLVDEQDILLGYGAGAIDYLSKPVHPDILRSKIAAYVDLYRKTRALAVANAALSSEVAERIKVQQALSEANLELEQRVEERTAELRRAMESESAARIEAEEQSRLKEEFLAVVSHELRTPLNAIYGWSELLGRSGIGAATLAEGLAAIRRNAKAQARLIEDLLDMSRITSSKARLDAHPVNLSEVVAAAVQTAQPAAAANGLRLDTVMDGGARLPAGVWVVGDFGRLQQIIGNLLSNAIKFSSRGGTVTVLVRGGGPEVEVVVQDTGQGIDPKFLPHLFSKFRQADGSTTRRHGGLGLGLAIVRQLVELHGGRVRAESAGPGQGASFAVTLPSMTPPGMATSLPAHGRQPAAGSRLELVNLALAGVRVLCVDDEPDARQLLHHVLGQKQAIVTLAASTEEALAMIEKDGFDVLVSDIGMPGRDGYELIRSVRVRQSGGRHLPAIALTAYARREDREIALTEGFDEHVSKPVDADKLVAAIARLVG
jgi:signal transduction histidine kinase